MVAPRSSVHWIVSEFTAVLYRTSSSREWSMITIWLLPSTTVPALSMIIWDGSLFFLPHSDLVMMVSGVFSGSQGQAGEPICVVAMTTYCKAVKLSVISPCWRCFTHKRGQWATQLTYVQCLFSPSFCLRRCHCFVPQRRPLSFLFLSTDIYFSMFCFLSSAIKGLGAVYWSLFNFVFFVQSVLPYLQLQTLIFPTAIIKDGSKFSEYIL